MLPHWLVGTGKNKHPSTTRGRQTPAASGELAGNGGLQDELESWGHLVHTLSPGDKKTVGDILRSHCWPGSNKGSLVLS